MLRRITAWSICLLLLLDGSCHRSVTTLDHQREPEPHSTWGAPLLVLIVPFDAPTCAWWAAEQAWEVLSPVTGLEIRLGVESAVVGPIDGLVTLTWDAPPDPSAKGLTAAWRRHSPRGLETVSANVWIDTCDARLFAHELGHALGLRDKDHPGDVMHWRYADGGWRLSEAEQRHLKGLSFSR
jgi:hypothetical protein